MNETEDKGSDAGASPLPHGIIPGPWHWYAEDFSMAILCGETNGHADPLERHVLTVTMCRSCHDRAKANKREAWEWGDCYACDAAHARLIAAAPTMLEALQAMDKHWSEDFSGPDSPALHHTSQYTWALIRSAISKATGAP